jgi:transcriptional regulator of heat shock response
MNHHNPNNSNTPANNNNNNEIALRQLNNEKVEMKELIEKYQANLDKINKIKRAVKQLSLEQEDIKEKIKVFMKKHQIQNIFTQDGGKVVYQIHSVQPPINKKFLESRIVELVGENSGKELISKIFLNKQPIKRESVLFRPGKTNGQIYV